MRRARRPALAWNLLFVGVGVAALLASRHLPAPLTRFGQSHGANLAASFGAFFVLRLFPVFQRLPSWVTVMAALLAVNGVEIAQHAGLYPGTYDPEDFLYNAAGVLAAWGIHAILPPFREPTSTS